MPVPYGAPQLANELWDFSFPPHWSATLIIIRSIADEIGPVPDSMAGSASRCYRGKDPDAVPGLPYPSRRADEVRLQAEGSQGRASSVCSSAFRPATWTPTTADEAEVLE